MLQLLLIITKFTIRKLNELRYEAVCGKRCQKVFVHKPVAVEDPSAITNRIAAGVVGDAMETTL